jgi:hypothetical protein
MTTTIALTLSLILALYDPFCTAKVTATMPPWDAPVAELWQSPDRPAAAASAEGRVATRDLFYGPWGPERAPDPRATYAVVERKPHGTNRGIRVRDPQGREWDVKYLPQAGPQAASPMEVVLSRVLSAVGYHQPPVYFQPSLTVRDERGTHIEPGGRFRLSDKSIKAIDTWRWQQNPFVGMRPYQGLLVILLMFGTSDIKDGNNVLYQVEEPGAGPRHWYVVHDVNATLDSTGAVAAFRGDPDTFERQPFMLGAKNGVVRFNYHGGHEELLRRIDPLDVAFAVDLLEQLRDEQWRDAFRAGGYQPGVADRLIAQLYRRIDEARRIADEARVPAASSR